MIKFNATYHNNSTYPISLGNFFERLCIQVGLQAGSKEFINSDFIVESNPFEEETTCKVVLSKIAELAGGFAHIGRDNKVYIINPKNIVNLLRVKDVNTMKVGELSETKVKYLRGNIDMRVKDVDTMPVKRLTLKQIKYLTGTKQHSVDFKLDGNNYLDDFAKNNVWGELNSLTVTTAVGDEYTTTQDLESIRKYGLTELTIEQNPFLKTKASTETVINNIWEYLKYFKYLPFETSYYGYPYVDCGDVIYVTDTKENRFVSYIFNHTFTYNGAYSGKIETQALTKAQVTYKNSANIQSRLNKVETLIKSTNRNVTTESSSIRNDLQNMYNEFNPKIEEIETIKADNEEIKLKIEEINTNKIGTNEIILKLNQTEETDKIDGDRISFEGKTITVNDISISEIAISLKDVIQRLTQENEELKQRIEKLEGENNVEQNT